MRVGKPKSWSSESGSKEIPQLNHAIVVRHALTKSKIPELKHFDMVSKIDILPLESNDSDKFLNHSSLDSSSSSCFS